MWRESQSYRHAVRALAEAEIDAKLALTEAAWNEAQRLIAPAAPAVGRLTPEAARAGAAPEVGWPARPPLAEIRALPRRSARSRAGRAALLHAIAHIEFSAINLALDHALRFPAMPDAYAYDWLRVAAEEVGHFRLLREHLRRLGHDYGDFAVHRSLWRMAERSSSDALARMALVPRLLEARGLDATPPIQAALEAAGDVTAARLLDVILHDEIGHVATGDLWFRALCQTRALPAETTYRQLISDYNAPWPAAPLNEAARLAAGFSAEELALLARRR